MDFILGYLRAIWLFKDSHIPIWAIGGKTRYIKNLLETDFGKTIAGAKVTETQLFGSNEHDGIVSLNSQISFKYPEINSIIINQPTNHTVEVKSNFLNIMRKIVIIFKFLIPEKDKEKLLSLQNELSISQTYAFTYLVNKFVEKYGLYPTKDHPNDDALIKECSDVTLIEKP